MSYLNFSELSHHEMVNLMNELHAATRRSAQWAGGFKPGLDATGYAEARLSANTTAVEMDGLYAQVSAALYNGLPAGA